jgi:hypothetical protein
LQAKLGKKLWNRVVSPIKEEKRYGVNKNNFNKIILQGLTELNYKRPVNINIFLLFRLGLISSKIFKKLYYFRINNKKYLKRKYANKNYSLDCNINKINWESDINFDFLISNYCDSYIPFANKSRVARIGLKFLSFDHPKRPL